MYKFTLMFKNKHSKKKRTLWYYYPEYSLAPPIKVKLETFCVCTYAVSLELELHKIYLN